MESRLGRLLDIAAEESVNTLAALYAIVGVGSIILTVVFAFATGTWALLLILLVPAIWLLMWMTD